jgi:glycosyltransferase involved in cell wall biosynthesis
MNEQRDTISVVTPCYNDHSAFDETLASLQEELTGRDEWLVVDSSTDASLVERRLARSALACPVRVIRAPPRGVYAALNAGVGQATKHWVQVVNCGDGLKPGARAEMTRAVEASPAVAIHVFRQQAGRDGQAAYVFSPDGRGIWPHQSILTERRVHEILGVYDTRYRLTADQLFFAKARAGFYWQLHAFVLTYYDLDGMSSVVSPAASRELYAMWRALGRRPVESIFRAWVSPAIRNLVQKVMGRSSLHRIKRMVFRHYRSGGA